MLERWRADRTSSSASSRSVASRAPRSGASTRARRPPTASPAPTTCSRACSRTSTRATGRCAASYVPRKAGWDCHGLPVELEIEKELGISVEGRDRGVRDRRVQRPLPRVGLPLRRGLEPADRADRLLDRPRRPLRDPDQRLHRVGLVVAAPDLGRRSPLQGHKVVPYCPRCGTALSSHEVAPGLPRRRGPLGLRAPAGHRAATAVRWSRATTCSSGRRPRGR